MDRGKLLLFSWYNKLANALRRSEEDKTSLSEMLRRTERN